LSDDTPEIDALIAKDKNFADWMKSNISQHKIPGYAIVNAHAVSPAPVFWYLVPFIAVALVLALTPEPIPLSGTPGIGARGQAGGGGGARGTQTPPPVPARDTASCATHKPLEKLRDETQKQLDDHAALNCQYTAVGGYFPKAEEFTRENWDKFIADFNAVVEKLKGSPLKLGYHNHSHEFQHFGETRGMDILYEESDPVGFQFELDTYWVQHGGASPVAWINKCAGRLPVIHFKDMRINNERSQYYCEVGRGNLDWAGIIAACEAADIEWYIVEQDVCEGDPFDSMKISFDNLKAMGVE